MADPDVYRTAMARHGIDADHYLACAQEPEIKQRLIERTDAAVARGVFGVPTFFVGDEMFFGKERLAQVIEAATLA